MFGSMIQNARKSCEVSMFWCEEDEWVNVKKAVRKCSIPMDSSEYCRKVSVGDLVLCFRENSDQATCRDAHLVEIERKLHDIRGCRCLFLIRYDRGQTGEVVAPNQEGPSIQTFEV